MERVPGSWASPVLLERLVMTSTGLRGQRFRLYVDVLSGGGACLEFELALGKLLSFLDRPALAERHGGKYS